MGLDCISLIFTILGVLLGILGIIVSKWCWKHNYKELQNLKSLKEMNLFTEGGFVRFHSEVLEVLKENPTAVNPFKFTGKFDEDSIKASIFNMCQNNLNKVKSSEQDII